MAGIVMLHDIPRLATDGTGVREHVGGSSLAPAKLGLDAKSTVYAGFLAPPVDLVVAALATIALRAMRVDDGVDGTAETDDTAEREDPTFRDLPDPLEPAAPGAAGGAPLRR